MTRQEFDKRYNRHRAWVLVEAGLFLLAAVIIAVASFRVS